MAPREVVLKSVNRQVNGTQSAESFTVKDTFGFPYTFMYSVFVIVLLPEGLPTVSVTVYTPGFKYVVDGFLREELVPLPRFQFHDVGLPVELSVKFTTSGAQPERGEAVKSAVG